MKIVHMVKPLIAKINNYTPKIKGKGNDTTYFKYVKGNKIKKIRIIKM